MTQPPRTTFEPGLVSVIIPTYNRSRNLLEAVESVKKQTYQNIEIIVVDDGSTDDTRAVASELTDVRYVYQENQRQAAARNAGLNHARGEFLCTLDSDDLWKPEFLTKSVEAIKTLDVEFVFANWSEKDRKGLRADNYFQQRHSKWPSTAADLPGWRTMESSAVRTLYLQICASPSSAIVFRHETVKQYGWSRGLNIGDDWCLLLDIVINRPVRIAFTLEHLWIKCVNGDNICDQLEMSRYIKRLLIDDHVYMLNRFYDQLTTPERCHLFGRIAYYSLVLTRSKLKRGEFKAMAENASSAFKHLYRGMRQSPWQTIIHTRGL